MKSPLAFCLIFFFSGTVTAQLSIDSAALRNSLDKATAAIRTAFANGDAELVGRLHSPDVIKYFGGDKVIRGRDAVQKGATDWFKNTNVAFTENTVEDTKFFGPIAIQTSIFEIKTTPKNGGKSSSGRGRSMVIYVQDKTSPTGWLTLREIVQEAPARP